MSKEIIETPKQSAILSNIVLNGDLSKMDNSQKTEYYKMFCSSLGLNPVTQPFKILRLQGKEKLYATKDATEQLRKIHGVSFVNTESEFNKELGFYKVIVTVKDGNGRQDFGTGVVAVQNLKGDDIANAIMKAETKAKRRATLSICGLGMLDESERDTMPQTEDVALEVVQDEKDYTDFSKYQDLAEWVKNNKYDLIDMPEVAHALVLLQNNEQKGKQSISEAVKEAKEKLNQNKFSKFREWALKIYNNG